MLTKHNTDFSFCRGPVWNLVPHSKEHTVYISWGCWEQSGKY